MRPPHYIVSLRFLRAGEYRRVTMLIPERWEHRTDGTQGLSDVLTRAVAMGALHRNDRPVKVDVDIPVEAIP